CPPVYHPRIQLFLRYGRDTMEDEVPDPYYGGPAGFDIGSKFRNEGIGLLLSRDGRPFRLDDWGGSGRRGFAGLGRGLVRLRRGLRGRSLHLRVPDVQRFLDSRHCGFGRVLRLL
ncbi:MAG TPA: hypothetical protein PLX20_16580, partial [Rhodocyclaceae bacterium]|nr:hypothetical protein [Rhodocyclaceae bacterium]